MTHLPPVAQWQSQDHNPGALALTLGLSSSYSSHNCPSHGCMWGEAATLVLWLKCDQYWEIRASCSALATLFARGQNITGHHCQWAVFQRHDLFQKCWCSWCLYQPKVILFCLFASSVFSLQHRGLGRAGGSHRNHRGCADSRPRHRIWDPAAGQRVCHWDSLLSTSDILYRSRQPGREVRSSTASFPALHFCAGCLWTANELWDSA